MQPPPIVSKPPLARWLFERSMSLRDAANYFETSAETLRRACSPFEDPLHRPPHTALMRRIIDRTAGEVTASDWFPDRAQAAA